MFIRAIAFLLFLATVALAQQPTPILPEPKLTPGDSFPVAVQDLCVTGYTKKVRNVPAEMKRQVYEEYGFKSSGDYEVDHLIPLELGGSSSIKNLWPESLRTSPWSAQAKDQLERKLHKLVCSGQLDSRPEQGCGDRLHNQECQLRGNPGDERVIRDHLGQPGNQQRPKSQYLCSQMSRPARFRDERGL
jgi:hypothetical protein